MARRKILKAQDRRELFDIPADEDSLIRRYSLSTSDRLEIDLRRREHNKLGFAVQLCVMRHPGRVLAAGEIPPRAMLKYVADQIGTDPTAFTSYARREETRHDHIARLMIYLAVRRATTQDHRAGLLSAIEAAAMSNSGGSIVNAIVATMRKRGALLPALEIIERMALAARAITATRRQSSSTVCRLRSCRLSTSCSRLMRQSARLTSIGCGPRRKRPQLQIW